MPLDALQRKTLRRLGHDRKPIVLLGAAGLTESVVAEVGRALDAHELVKVRVRSAERGERDATIEAMCTRTGAELIQRIGHVALLYRRHPERPRLLIGEDAGA